MLTEQMKKDLANPADVIEIVTSGSAEIKAMRDHSSYYVIDISGRAFGSQSLRETAAVFNALADTLDKQSGGANG